MLKPLEARTHRLRLHEVGLGGWTTPTFTGPVLCGVGSCGDVLADVMLVPLNGQLVWKVSIARHYSQVASGVWRWRQHLPRPTRTYTFGPETWKLTTRGDLIVTGPHGTKVTRGVGEYMSRMKRIGILHPGEALMIGCQREIPHMSRLSYEHLMR